MPVDVNDTPLMGAGSVDVGWLQLLADLHQQLHAIDPGYQVRQVKEKFGMLRVYLDASAPELADAVDDAVDEAERRSAETCERCGAAGVLRGGGWLKMLCDEHADGRAPVKFPPQTL